MTTKAETITQYINAAIDKASKINKRQATIYIVIVGFMLVTVGRVANYTGSFESDGWQWLGWLYAISVDIGIVICARFTEWKTTRLALPSFVLLVIASGALSIAHVEPWRVSWGAWVYAILPTVAQALLGFLARDAAKFTKSRSQSDVEKQLRAGLKESSATIKQLKAEFEQSHAELEHVNAELAQLKTDFDKPRAMIEATRTVFDKICTNLNGNKPSDARAVNKLLNDNGYYSVPDSTARTWAIAKE